LKDLLDLRDLLVPPAPLAALVLLALWVTPVRGALLVSLVCLALMESLGLLELQLCCPSVLVRVEEIRVPSCLRRKPRQQPSCLRPGWH